KRLARYAHRPQEPAADEPVDAVGQLCTRETYEVGVVEKVSQSEAAARAGHLELLEQNEGSPLWTGEPGLRHGGTSPFRAMRPGSIPEGPPEEPSWLVPDGRGARVRNE